MGSDGNILRARCGHTRGSCVRVARGLLPLAGRSNFGYTYKCYNSGYPILFDPAPFPDTRDTGIHVHASPTSPCDFTRHLKHVQWYTRTCVPTSEPPKAGRTTLFDPTATSAPPHQGEHKNNSRLRLPSSTPTFPPRTNRQRELTTTLLPRLRPPSPKTP